MRLIYAIALLPALALISGCSIGATKAEKPKAVALTEEAAGHYCQMTILEHEGPKAQAHLAGLLAPLWFSQVRDGLAYLKSPEQSAELLILYVNDMGAAKSWAEPGIENWIDANAAYFVVGSDAIGGMGAPELVPFSDQNTAKEFAGTRGGEVMRLSEIPVELVLSPVEFDEGTLEHTQ